MQSEDKFSPWVSKIMQQETGELKESEDGTAEFETPTDDEEEVFTPPRGGDVRHLSLSPDITPPLANRRLRR